MKRSLFHAVLTAALVAGWAAGGNFSLAQEGPPAARFQAEPENQGTAESDSSPEAVEQRLAQLALELKDLPKRDLTVEVLQRARVPRRSDSRENKFAVVLHLQPASSGNAFRRLSSAQRRELLRDLPSENWLSRNPSEQSEHFKTLASQAPEKWVPEKSIVEFLTSAAANRDIEYQAQVASSGGPEFVYRIFAPTAEEAERRARAIVQLYDAGYSRPIQRKLLEKGQAVLADIRSKAAALPKIATEIAAEEALLAKPSEITPDILSQLKAQKVMVAVELAGLNARVKACDAMLGEPRKLEISTLQSISDMKVKAEIERVGIKDKLEQINVFIQEGDQRTAVQKRHLELVAKRDDLQAQIRSQMALTSALAGLISQYSFEVKGFSVGPTGPQTE